MGNTARGITLIPFLFRKRINKYVLYTFLDSRSLLVVHFLCMRNGIDSKLNLRALYTDEKWQKSFYFNLC